MHGFFHLLSCGYPTVGGEKGQGEKAEASARLDSQNIEHDNYHDVLNHNCPLSSTRCCESNQITCQVLTSLGSGTICKQTVIIDGDGGGSDDDDDYRNGFHSGSP